jgi:hypothetical protein
MQVQKFGWKIERNYILLVVKDLDWLLNPHIINTVNLSLNLLW